MINQPDFETRIGNNDAAAIVRTDQRLDLCSFFLAAVEID